jgi:acyl-ACP thioesterase
MKVELKRQVRYGEVDPFFKQKIGSLFKLFTDAAVRHSESAGFGPRQLIRTGRAWVLNKFGVRIHRYPEYGEALRVLTWHRGQKGVRAYREFEVFAGNQRLAAASSVWLYIDMQNKKILRLPETVGADYTVETQTALDMVLDGWKGQRLFPVETHVKTTIRRSDYDPVGHVNNAAYLDYLETSVLAGFGETARIRTLNIEFLKEINRNVRAISTGMKDTGQGCLFKINNDAHVYACGELTL